MDQDTGYTGQLFRRLTEEHRAILAALDLLIDSDTPDPVERRKAFAWIARATRIQAEAEDRILFPLLDGSHELHDVAARPDGILTERLLLLADHEIKAVKRLAGNVLLDRGIVLLDQSELRALR